MTELCTTSIGRHIERTFVLLFFNWRNLIIILWFGVWWQWRSSLSVILKFGMICHVKYLEFLFPYCAQNRPDVSGGHMTFVGLAFRAWAVFGVILLIVIGHRHIFFYLFYCSLIEEFSVSCSDRCFFMRATNVLVHRILLLSFIQVLLGVISRELAFLNIW